MSPTYDSMKKKQASFHSRQGRLWRLCSKFLLVCFTIGMFHEQPHDNSSPVCIAQLSSANNAVCFVWFHKFSELPPEANTWAHCLCRSTAWSLGAVRRKFSDFNFKLIPLKIYPRPTLFNAKAGITLNCISSVSYDNLLTHATSHWHWLCKNHNGRSRTALCMPRNEVDSRANGLTKTQAPADRSQNKN